MRVFCTLFHFLAIINAAPTGTNTATSKDDDQCQAKIFDQAWTLTNITIYKEAGQQSGNEHAAMSFHFCDTNTGLELDTDCSGTVVNDRCEGEDGGYVFCNNDDVSFKFSSGLVMMNRYYIDDCLGPWPYNSGRAFGENNTDMVSTTENRGTLLSQAQLLVPITSQI